MKKYNLFLDDKRTLKMAYDHNLGLQKVMETEEIVMVKNYDEFVETIELRGLPEFISFDHDLGHFITNEEGESVERTGKTCADWLGSYCMENKLKIPSYYVHSDNTVGKENIKKTLDFYAKYISLI